MAVDLDDVARAEEPLVPRSATDTSPHWRGTKPLRRERVARRIVLAVLGVVLLLGATGWLGVREARVSAAGGGFELSVTYARVTRPGLATPWIVTVKKAGGFDGPVTLRTTRHYLDMFDENGVNPDPEKSTASPGWLVWEFEPPDDDDELVVFLDTRLAPAQQESRRARTEVLVDGEPIVGVTYKTWVMP